MRVINARNVNDALDKGMALMNAEGEPVESRAGNTLEIPCPVATVYERPWERVLLCPTRDANPFFHLMESLWILAGRSDVKFLKEFNKRMAEYSDDGETFNAPYGYRLRNGNYQNLFQSDQLESVIEILKSDPNSRQAVCQIWDETDLNRPTKDKACNMSIVFRIRKGALTMTVYNRSNDMVWGAYGANVVQFSMIQEYVAAKIDVPMGEYTQVSNSFHVYTEGPGGEVWDRLLKDYKGDPTIYDALHTMGDIVRMNPHDMPEFDRDLKMFFKTYDQYGLEELGNMVCWESIYFEELVMPMLCVYLVHKIHGPKLASERCEYIKSEDWRLAAEDWFSNRIK